MKLAFTSPGRWLTTAGISSAAAAIGLTALPLALIGQWFDLWPLRTFAPSLPYLMPLTGVGLAFAALALGLLRTTPVPQGFRIAGMACALAASLIGLARMIDYLTPLDLMTDPGISFFSGFALLFLGLSLLLLDVEPRRGPQPGQFCALVVLHEILLVAMGLAFDNKALYVLEKSKDAGMSTHGALFAGVLALGILCARPNLGFTSLFLSPTSGGVVTRRLLLLPYVAFFLTAIFCFGLHWIGVLPTELRGWLWVFLIFFSTTTFIWWVSAVLQRNEDEKNRFEQRFRAVAETAVQSIFTADDNGAIIYCNPSAKRTFGMSAEQALGQPFTRLLARSSLDPYLEELERLRSSESSEVVGSVIDIVARRLSGDEFPVEMSLAVWNVAGKSFFTAILNDVSRRKHAEAETRAANEQLTAANKELEAFSYSVSHDLRAPLRAINGFTKILLEEYCEHFPAEGQDYLREVRDGARQMGQLVDDLLAFARLGRQSVKTQVVAPAEVVQECLDGLRAERDGRKLEITVQELGRCHGDPALLKQVWTNLLANALKYTRKKELARVEVGCERNGDDLVTYFVRDNGVGFDMRYVHKLFGVFQRLHRAEEYEGTGVGLAIVQRIVHRHGGRVWADARPGEGATFYFSLKGADT